MPFVFVVASVWLANPRMPEERWRTALVGTLVLVFSVTSAHYVWKVLA